MPAVVDTGPNCHHCQSFPGICDCPGEITCHHCEEESDCTCAVCDSCGDCPCETLCEECDQCADCCDCWTCSEGTRREHRCQADDDRCDLCERCENHCECHTCGACDERYADGDCCPNGCSYCEYCDNDTRPRDWCSECDRCTGCCTCEPESEGNVERVTARKIFHESERKEFARNPCKRFLSCELEVADAPNDDGSIADIARKWKAGIVDDGSLPSTGFEINTAPANGDKFVEQIEEFCLALKRADSLITTDCGYHVHADARDFNFWDLRKLVKVYARIEDALFAIVPRSRRSNHACQRCGQNYLAMLEHAPRKAKKSIIFAAYPELNGRKDLGIKEALKNRKREKYSQSRYHALNLHSWFYRGTLECRLAAGTINPTKVINWAILWGTFLDYCKKTTELQIEKLPETSWECLLAVAPEMLHNWLAERKKQFSRSLSNQID